MNIELMEALTILEKEKNISKDVMMDAIENSLISACKNHFGTSDNIKVIMDRDTCDYAVYAEKNVVEEVEDPALEISLEEAEKLDSALQVGDIAQIPVHSKEFGRIATQNAKNLILQKIREEERGIVLQVDESILFDSGKAEIKSESINVLDTIAKIIQETDNEIVAEGNTDNVPINSAAYRTNWELSTERALSIVRYLIENKNINPNRISLKGYGEFNPIVPNDTPENKAKNRRVDILVVEERESKTENKNNNVENK